MAVALGVVPFLHGRGNIVVVVVVVVILVAVAAVIGFNRSCRCCWYKFGSSGNQISEVRTIAYTSIATVLR